jgi:GNAT superfamily N-acetyltransferase
VQGPIIRPARNDEIEAVGALVALSFNDLAANAYLVPPPADRQHVCGDYFTLYTAHAFDHGRVDVVESDHGLSAAAVWFDRTRDLPEPAHYERRLADMTGRYLTHFHALDTLFEMHHPAEPHWHLAFLAAHPTHQNNGLGSALLKHLHDEMDGAGVPQYLEASDENCARLYRRHGYQDMNPFAIRLPDRTPFFRMWRPPSRDSCPLFDRRMDGCQPDDRSMQNVWQRTRVASQARSRRI